MTEKKRSNLAAENLRQKQQIRRVLSAVNLSLTESNLLTPGAPLWQSDVDKAEQVLQAVFPIDIDTYRTHAHLQCVRDFSRDFAIKLGLNPYRAQLLALGHDDGRFTTHNWARNELIAGRIFKHLGIRNDLLEGAVPAVWEVPKEVNSHTVENYLTSLTLEQKVLIMADICGKRKFDDWGILTFDEVMQYHQRQRGKEKNLLQIGKAVFPSEKRLTANVINFYSAFYKRLRSWFNEQGIDIEKVRLEILEREKKSPVKVVIFDIGDVLIPNPDSAIIAAFSKYWNLPTEDVGVAYNAALTRYRTGEINNGQFVNLFKNLVNKPMPTDYDTRITAGLSAVINPEMSDILASLKKNGYLLSTLSDTIPDHIQFWQRSNFFDHFDVPMTSVDFRVSKKDLPAQETDSLQTRQVRDVAAFACAVTKLNLPPAVCVFVDDKSEYLKKAER